MNFYERSIHILANCMHLIRNLVDCLCFKCFKEKHCSIFRPVHTIISISPYAELFVQNLVMYPIILPSSHNLFGTTVK